MDGGKIVQKGYNKIAKKYHAQRARFDNGKELAKFMKLLPKNASVLDLGCGAGVPISKTLVKRGFAVTGIDIAKSMLALAKKNVPKAKFLRKDMTKLDFKANSFDGAVSFYAIIHVPRERHAKIFRGLHKALKNKGVFLVCLGNDRWEATEKYMGTTMFWSQNEPKKALSIIRRAGFRIMFAKTLVRGGETHFWVIARNVK
ncbi:Ubiquinone/menaquinone biosynthesis C-methyltransferase UbiE [Candidatus Anstonella stagnisolia]|nr:Ubiquinone/menaquinone biosynthesis C-methyltransferase UbiE [Candidatus Anstonella stagnisolia]